MQTVTQRRNLAKVRLLPEDLIRLEALILEETDRRHSTTYRVSSHGPISYAYDSIAALAEADQAPATLPNIQFTFMDHRSNLRFDVEIQRRFGTISASSPPDQQAAVAQKIAKIGDFLQERAKLKPLAPVYGKPPIAAAVLAVLLIPYLIATMARSSYLTIFLLAVPLLIHLLLFAYCGAAANEIVLRR
ncbi:MAG TPA: hypothetical protein VGE07_18345 [Herpetosiphonaceae bacterium]